MLSSIMLQCPKCEEVSYYSWPYIEGQFKAMKMHKMKEVAQQMHDKRGPFYDRWKAAMDLRGEQRRCIDCRSYDDWPGDCSCLDNLSGRERVTGGQFACKRFYGKPKD